MNGKTYHLLLIPFLGLICCNYISVNHGSQKLSTLEKKRVIVSVDAGLDDYYALMVLLYAEKQNLVKIEAVVCSAGNTNLTNVVKNTVRLLELTNRTDIPLYKGVNEPLFIHKPLKPYYGVDGLGDLHYNSEPSLKIVRPELAAEAINRLVVDNPRQISLLSLGPLTNLAITAKLYSSFMSSLKDIWILGGNYRDANQSGASTEFNFLFDTGAAHIFFESSRRSNIYLYTIESFMKPTITYDWLYNIPSGKKPAMALAKRAEKSLHHERTSKFWIRSDAFLAFCFVQPEHCRFNNSFKTVDIKLCSSTEEGWIVFNSQNRRRNVRLINDMDQDEFKKHFVEVSNAV